jgi:hypothetical protein
MRMFLRGHGGGEEPKHGHHILVLPRAGTGCVDRRPEHGIQVPPPHTHTHLEKYLRF